MTGYVQVYTGNGKGKTTAAFGLALRAAGAGLRIYIAQFMKMGDYSELKALARFQELITIEQFGTGRFVRGRPAPEEVGAARAGLTAVTHAVNSGQYDMVIVEEGNVAVSCGLLTVDNLLDLITTKPEALELVITGRSADARIIEAADLVTEMREVKHYYQKGVAARVGIEK
jgi:cob(I)alamin adenosyltransferase